MNTAISHSPLEKLLLFRGIAKHGLEAPAFVRISDTLQHNGLVTNSLTYDAARLSPDSLEGLFLALLWEELKSESNNSVRPDGELSPASKKRKLQSPAPPTLRDARQHLGTVKSICGRLEEEYIRQTILEIRRIEDRFDQLRGEIGLLEEANRQDAVNQTARSKSPNGLPRESANDRDSGKVNGANPRPRPLSRPPLQISPPVPPPIPQQTSPPVLSQPLPGAARWQATVNGSLPPSESSPRVPVSTPSPASIATLVTLPSPSSVAPSTSAPAQVVPPAPVLAPAPALAPAPTPTPKPASLASVSAPTSTHPNAPVPPPPPAQSQPQTDFSSRRHPNQQIVGIEKQSPPDNTPSFASSPRPQPQRPQEIPTASNATRQVLQPPRGIPPFQAPHAQFTPPPVADGLQRPDNIPRPKQSPVPLPSIAQQDAQAQLKWEPFYQPSNSPIHQAQAPHPHGQQPLIQPPQLPQLPQPLQSQRLPQPPPHHAVHHGARPLQPHTGKPLQHQVLTPPQNAGHPHYQQPQHLPAQHLPPQHLAPIRPAPESHGYQKPASPWPPFPHPVQTRINQPQLPSPYHGFSPTGVRSPATHSQTLSPTGTHPRPSQLAPPQPQQQQPHAISQPQVSQPLQAPSPFNQRGVSSGPPSPALPDPQRGHNSPYQPPTRPPIPERVQSYRPSVVTTPAPATSAARFALNSGPHTPAFGLLPRLITGSGTKWSKASTPSTPKHGTELRLDDIASPAPEPLSPVLKKSVLPPVAPQEEIKNEPLGSAPAPLPPAETPTVKRKPGRPRGSQKAHDAASPRRSVAPEDLPSQEQKSPAKELPKLTVEAEQTMIKDEVTTPNPATEAGDTTADESVASRRQSKRRTKRKRDELSPSPVQTPVESQVPIIPDASVEPNTVVWTRSFHKVSASAMEQIVRHRLANMFAAPIREKDAPGYHKLILQPQDLKSIKAAIMTGNRAAAQAAAALPAGDPGTSSVRLPTSEELMPPRAIINSSQLDRELAHMFSNAIMYNPDHGHGPGPTFMVREDEENQDEDGEGEDHGGGAAHQGGHQQEHILGYKVDEYGVVHDTRAMFQDVDKWLSELRSAEIERGYKPPATGTSTRQASVAGGGLQGEHSFSSNTATTATVVSGLAGGDMTMDDADEQTGTEPETAVKRRRTTRGT